MAVIPIEIVSDVICPWCFIGYRTLERAMTLYKKTYPGGSQDTLEIQWTPYFIDLVEPQGSLLINDRMSRKMTPAQITAAHTRLSRTGKSLGIGFKFGGSIGSSRLAHRVLYLAGEQDGSGETQSRVSVALFKRQFELELDVSELEVVVAAAVEGGLEEVAVRGFLERGGGVKEVEDEAKRVRERGVRGVPQFFFAGEHSFEGAGDIEEFFEAFVKARG